MRTSILVIFVIIGLNSLGFSQIYTLLPKFYQPLDSSVLVKNNKKEEPKKSTLMKRHERVSYSVTLGTGYNSFGNDISMMNSYIAPSVNYWASSKLNFKVTGIIMQNNFSGMEGMSGLEPGYSINSNMSNYGISGSAYYQLSEKWSFWGDGMYLENQSVFSNYSSEVYDNDFKTVSVGVAYKVNDTFHFNIQCRFMDGLNPAYNYNSPYYSPGFSPYRSDFDIWGY